MNEFNNRLEIKGFEPSDEQRFRLNLFFQQIESCSPSDSHVKLTLERIHQRHYLGSLQIRGSHLRIADIAQSENFEELLQNLTSQALEKITQWQRERFIEDEAS